MYIDSLNRRNHLICDEFGFRELPDAFSLFRFRRCLDRAEPLCLCAGEGSEGSEARGKYERLETDGLACGQHGVMESEGLGSYS